MFSFKFKRYITKVFVATYTDCIYHRNKAYNFESWFKTIGNHIRIRRHFLDESRLDIYMYDNIKKILNTVMNIYTYCRCLTQYYKRPRGNIQWKRFVLIVGNSLIYDSPTHPNIQLLPLTQSHFHSLGDTSTVVQYIPRNMHTVFALLCFVVVIHWLIFPYPSGLLHWHCGNLTIAPGPAKQPWWIWTNTPCEFIMNDCITTTKQSTTKPCAYFLGYTVLVHSSLHSVTGTCSFSHFHKLTPLPFR